MGHRWHLGHSPCRPSFLAGVEKGRESLPLRATSWPSHSTVLCRLIQGLEDQIPWKGAELEEKGRAGSLGMLAGAPAGGRKGEQLSQEEAHRACGVLPVS